MHLEHRRQGDAAGGGAAPAPVRARHPVELHIGAGRGDALQREGAHGAVEGEDVEVALAVEDQMAAEGVEDAAAGIDAQRHLGGRDALVGSVLEDVDVRLPDVRVVGQRVQVVPALLPVRIGQPGRKEEDVYCYVLASLTKANVSV